MGRQCHGLAQGPTGHCLWLQTFGPGLPPFSFLICTKQSLGSRGNRSHQECFKAFHHSTVQCQRAESSSFVLAHLNDSEIFVSILMSYGLDLFLCVGRGKPLKQIKPADESVEIIPAVTVESLMDTSIKQISKLACSVEQRINYL